MQLKIAATWPCIHYRNIHVDVFNKCSGYFILFLLQLSRYKKLETNIFSYLFYFIF